MPQEHRAALASLLAQASYEVFPARGVEDAAGQLPEGARVAVSCSPTRGIDATLALSERLARRGLQPVPHLAARLVADLGHLQRIVERLAGIGVAEVFVVGGDVAAPAGPFPSALDLLNGLAAVSHELDRIGVTAYPDGHPFLDDDTLWRSLQAKQPLADYMVTQVCFDPQAIGSWIAEVRRRGIHLPVHIGVPGVMGTRKLLRFSLRIGVANSARLLTRHTDLAARLLGPTQYRPDGLVAGLASMADDPGRRIQALHLYTFNEVESTERWRWQALDDLGAARATR